MATKGIHKAQSPTLSDCEWPCVSDLALFVDCGNINFSEEAWLCNPHEASTGNQSPGLQVEEIWPVYLLWKSLHLSHLSGVSDSFWTCGPQSC